MKKKFDINNTQNHITNSFQELVDKTDFPSHFFESFYKGQREIYQKEFTQIKLFDEKWIRTIEAYYPSLSTISKRLKSTLKYQEEILPIEKTKKVGPRAIRHLSSHSEFIRDVDEDDEVIPSKVLSDQSEIDYGIYENRFVATLISRLVSFISERLKIIEEELQGQRDTHLSYKSEFEFTDIDYEISIDVKQKEKINKRKASEHNQNIYERAQHLFKLVNHLNNSDFMRIMKKYKPVTAPIMKTQIILKNPDFKNAYLLWLFLDKYYILDYHLDTKTVNKRFSKDYSESIDNTMLMLFSSFFSNDHANLDGESLGKAKYRSKKAIQRKKIEDDFIIDPYVYEVEPHLANEYFLEKNKRIFKDVYKKSIENGYNYTIGLKNALTQSLKITNDIYTSFFEVDQDQDVFDRLLQDDDPIKDLDEAYNKHKIARIIREVKEKDYKEAIKLEKKWQRSVTSKQKEMISYEKKVQSQKLQDTIDKIKQNYSEEYNTKKRNQLKEKEIMARDQKEELNRYTKKLQDQLKKEKVKLKEKERQKLAKEKERLKKIADDKKAKQRERIKKQKEALKKKLMDKKAKLREKNQKKLAEEKAKAKARLKKKKLIEQEKQEKIIKEDKDKLISENLKIKQEIQSIEKKL
ncbi:DUF2357 domain-containing protein [Mycoplasmatota bacterium]|nr:DUF2357 domain-containing protein [Mycoplasmatota bacterium]